MALKERNNQKNCACPYSGFTNVSIGKKPKKKKSNLNGAISWMAVLSLVLAFIYGQFFNQVDFTSVIALKNDRFDIALLEEHVYKLSSTKDNSEQYIGLQS